MLVSKDKLGDIIVEVLRGRELPVLQLTLAVHKQLDRYQALKGNLVDRVIASCRALVASKRIVEDEGTFHLPR